MLRYISWFISALLVLFIAAAMFLYFSPDYNLYLVKGQSMEPAINMGDAVVIGPGTIVTYIRGNSPVTHRVVAVKGNSLVTKGDASEDPDPKPVMMSEVCGVYLSRVPYLGYFNNFMRTTVGWLVVVVAPTVLIVGFLGHRMIRVARGMKSEHGTADIGK